MFPLCFRGEPLGVLEVRASRQRIEAMWEVLLAGTEQIGVALHAVRPRTHPQHAGLDMGILWTAHELRRPLLAVKAALEVLQERHGMDPGEGAILGRSIRELDRLSATAQTLLGWAAGTRPLELGWTDLVRVAEEAVESCRLEGWGEDIVILSPPDAVGRFDPVHLRTAIANLVRNALAFAAPGTKVEVEIERRGDQLLLSVTDEAPWIPDEERSTIFDPFVRGSAGSPNREGVGLGLFIARHIVEAHGGRIWVDPEPNRTTFRVLLPAGGRSRRRSAS